MNRFEIYVLDDEGKLHPTGLWRRSHKIDQVEVVLSKLIHKIGKPCAILISELIPGVNDK